MNRAELLKQLQATLCEASHPMRDADWACLRCAHLATVLMPVIDAWTDGLTVSRNLLAAQGTARAGQADTSATSHRGW
ncbi:hypothetical protein ACHABX_02715 [Nesterenkonia halotolerans]|uniref:hypothetical protein n=1 Tax=Nesterenkonia halotolerans TaxID=225325 RepID=UPI003EE515CE